jgi:lipoprotein-releasing system permease protein
VKEELLREPHVVAVAPRIRGLALVAIPNQGSVTSGGSGGVQVLGIVPEDESRVTDFRSILGGLPPHMTVDDLADPFKLTDDIIDGQIEPHGGAVIGRRLFQSSKLNLHKGERITIVTVNLSSQGNGGARDTTRNEKIFAITGAFESGMYEIDTVRVYVPIDVARELRRMQSYCSEIAVRVDDPDRSYEVKLGLLRRLDRLLRVDQFSPGDVKTWEEDNKVIFSALEFEKRMLGVLLFVIVLVACGTILSILYMMVLEKRRDIGVLRSMGATVSGIARIFLYCGGIIGGLGSLCGVGFSLLFLHYINEIERWLSGLLGYKVFPAEIYVFNQIPARAEPESMALIALLTFAFSLLASFFPAFKAARAAPVEAIRYE